MNKVTWTKQYSGHETMINGFRVSRTTLQSGGHLYYVHWIENPHYAAPHSNMSCSPHRSLRSAKAFIKYLEGQPLRYFNTESYKQVRLQLSLIDKQFPKFGKSWKKAHDEYCSQFAS